MLIHFELTSVHKKFLKNCIGGGVAVVAVVVVVVVVIVVLFVIVVVRVWQSGRIRPDWAAAKNMGNIPDEVIRSVLVDTWIDLSTPSIYLGVGSEIPGIDDRTGPENLEVERRKKQARK